ncbi:MAG: hypothetical protein HKN26_06610, partial [Acidimicrobiales bacterium]|nr:hypothetical protein [Acidimicrobiales bacterium]
MARRRSTRAVAAVVGGMVIGLFVAAWLIGASLASGTTARNVSVGDIDLGGLSDAEVIAALEQADPTALGATSANVTLRIDGTERAFSADELGATLDVEATAADVIAREAPFAPWSWVGTYFGNDRVEPRFTIDRSQTADALSDLGLRTDPTEPSMVLSVDDLLVLEPGEPGRGVDVDQTVAAIDEAVRFGSPRPVDLVTTTVAPAVSDRDAQQLIDRLNEATENGITVTLDSASALLPADAVRAWLSMAVIDEELVVDIQSQPAIDGMAFLLGGDIPPGEPARFDVINNAVEIVGGRPGLACCTPDAPERLLRAIILGDDTVAVEPIEIGEDAGRQWAESMQITELVGEFTTFYTAGQSRTVNIARISDLTRGVVIEPGEMFSVNDFVGRRTTENGFVGAGVIYNGIYTEDVGGGISQYATTLFNAAFFAGLDFGEYQSHSLPISRYPYGREATLSFPNPDLQIINNTPYGVLLWPTTTATSITVQLWSTAYAPGEQISQTTSIQGVACTRVTTNRRRTFPDGHTETDQTYAVYRPAEGFDCQNNPTDPSFIPPPPPPPPSPPTAPPSP